MNLYLLKRELKENILIYIFIFFLYSIGTTAGIVVANNINFQNNNSITIYFFSALEAFKNSEASNFSILKNSYLQNLSFFAIIVLLGYARIGFIFVIIIILFKGVFLGFSIFTIFASIKFFKAAVLLISISPSVFLLLLVLIRASELSIEFSFAKLFSNGNITFLKLNNNPRRYFSLQLKMLIIILIASLWDAFIVPLIV